MRKEINGYLVSGSEIEQEDYKTGTCFDTCSQSTVIIRIPTFTDFSALFDRYSSLLATNKCELIEPVKDTPFQYPSNYKDVFLSRDLRWDNGRKSYLRTNSDYLNLKCKNQKDWTLNLSFYKEGARSFTNNTGSYSIDNATYHEVDRLQIKIEASTR